MASLSRQMNTAGTREIMAKFLTTHEIASHVEIVIRTAVKRLVVMSPYLRLSTAFFNRLQDADARGVKAYIFYGKDELHPNERAKLEQLTNVELCFMKNLHAKCYLNEQLAVIGSMNMYEFSEKNNREMGVLVTKLDDPDVFDDAWKETKSIYAEVQYESSTQASAQGFCIRCSGQIGFTPKKPLCENCYKEWAKYKNKNYREKHCHKCGNLEATTVARPLCGTCFTNLG